MPCVCSVIDHRGRQNVVRTSVTHSAAPRVPLFCSYYILKNQEGIRNNCINLVLAFLNYDSNNSQSPYEKEMLLSCSNFRQESQRSKFSINICVRRRKTHTNRVVFTEITLEGFINQSWGDRSWYHAIWGIGRHFGPADWLCGTNSLDLICKCFLGRFELKTPIANMAAKMRVLKVKWAYFCSFGDLKILRNISPNFDKPGL